MSVGSVLLRHVVLIEDSTVTIIICGCCGMKFDCRTVARRGRLRVLPSRVVLVEEGKGKSLKIAWG